jgi:hypothetical protein
MKAAYRNEAGYGGEERITPRIALPKATPEPKKASLRYNWWELAEHPARTSLYHIPFEPEEDVDEYTFVLGLAGAL